MPRCIRQAAAASAAKGSARGDSTVAAQVDLRAFVMRTARDGDIDERLRARDDLARMEPRDAAVETPIGHLPSLDDVNVDGIALSDEAKAKLFGFDHAGWRAEFESIGEYLDEYGPRMPQALHDEQQRIARSLAS